MMQRRDKDRARTMWLAGIGLVLSLTLGPAWSAVYKWTDEQGVVHYSKQPPPQSNAEEVRLHSPDPAEIKRARQRMEETESRLERKQEQRQRANEEAARDKKREARREKNCNMARENLDRLVRSRQILVTNDEGKAVRLTEEQRRARVEKTRAQVEEFCNS